MVETCNNQASSHVKVPYKTNHIQKVHPRNCQDHPKRPKNAKWVIFKRDCSLDTFLKVLVEVQWFLDSSHVRVPYGLDETNRRQ